MTSSRASLQPDPGVGRLHFPAKELTRLCSGDSAPGGPSRPRHCWSTGPAWQMRAFSRFTLPWALQTQSLSRLRFAKPPPVTLSASSQKEFSGPMGACDACDQGGPTRRPGRPLCKSLSLWAHLQSPVGHAARCLWLQPRGARVWGASCLTRPRTPPPGLSYTIPPPCHSSSVSSSLHHERKRAPSLLSGCGGPNVTSRICSDFHLSTEQM